MRKSEDRNKRIVKGCLAILILVVSVWGSFIVVRVENYINIHNYREIVLGQSVLFIVLALVGLPASLYIMVKRYYRFLSRRRKILESIVYSLLLLAALFVPHTAISNLQNLQLYTSSTICGFQVNHTLRRPKNNNIAVENEEGKRAAIEASDSKYNYLLKKYGDTEECMPIDEVLTYDNVFYYLLEIK